jgi:hypothetical protein
MQTTRRSLLKAFGALPVVLGGTPLAALAQSEATAVPAEVPPILFVHGNGDHAALWIAQIWRMESNGVARGRLAALNFTDPLARSDDGVAQDHRSSLIAHRPTTSAANWPQRSPTSSVAPAQPKSRWWRVRAAATRCAT